MVNIKYLACCKDSKRCELPVKCYTNYIKDYFRVEVKQGYISHEKKKTIISGFKRREQKYYLYFAQEKLDIMKNGEKTVEIKWR